MLLLKDTYKDSHNFTHSSTICTTTWISNKGTQYLSWNTWKYIYALWWKQIKRLSLANRQVEEQKTIMHWNIYRK